jgi:hypothetical protein
MEKYFVSLGFQCTVARVFETMGVKQQTLPFDWMLSSPKFVLDTLTKLLIENMDVEELVRTHFFTNDTRAEYHYPETHTGSSKMGWIPNTKAYNALFPHDLPDTPEKFENDTIKYVRRFNRLKELILDKSKTLTFIYISQSSSGKGNFIVDGKEVLTNVYGELNNIFYLLKHIRGSNPNIIMLDTINSNEKVMLLPEIKHISITPKTEWLHMVDECVEILRPYV